VLSSSAISKVASSIKEFGFQQPVVVDKEGVIVAGHTRFLAAQRLDMKEIPVVVATNLSPAQVKAYRLADNRTAQESSWDYELLSIELEELQTYDIDISLTGFDSDEIVSVTFEPPEMREYDEETDTPTAPADSFEFRVVIECRSEVQQAEILAQAQGMGWKCRALTS
jgi:ParB-like chromosome segregation protein Spo0J